jgi:hypothetical protein
MPGPSPYALYPYSDGFPYVVPTWVTLAANRPGAWLQRLEQRGKDEVWAPLCAAPCVSPLDPRYLYRVGSETARPSHPFTITGTTPTRVDADVGSDTAAAAGLVLAPIGTVIGLLGLLVVANGRDRDESTGTILSLTGAGILTTAVLLIRSGTNRLSFSAVPRAQPGSGGQRGSVSPPPGR